MITEVACGVMFDNNKKLLIGLRKDDYMWEFPGGKRELNETIEECLKREWKEELNLEIYIEKEICKGNLLILSNSYKNLSLDPDVQN